MRVKSDKYQAMINKMGPIADMMDIVPVDLYGKRINLDKNDPTNLEKTADDIQDFYGLESSKPDNDDDESYC